MFKKLVAGLVASAIFSASAVNLPTQKGDVDIAKMPEKIAVYDVGVLDSLVALGLGDKIVGVPEGAYLKLDLYKDFKDKTVGTMQEPNIEQLSALKPDLIIVAQRSAGKLEDVAKIAQSVDLTLKSDNFYQEGLKRLNDLAVVFEKTEEAKKVQGELDTLRDEVKKLGEGKGKILSILINGQKIALYGPTSRANWLKTELGLDLINDEKKAGRHGEPVTFEYVAEVNPDWIYALDRLTSIGQAKAGESAKEVLDNELIKNTKAFKEGKILYPDTTNIYINIGGPNALKGTLTELKEAFSK